MAKLRVLFLLAVPVMASLARAAAECPIGPVLCCTSDTQCDDGNPCNGTETCLTLTGTCLVGVQDDGPSCDDGLFCTGVDTCGGGECQHAGDPCAGGAECANACNEGAGDCLAPDGATCDDGLFCNGADQCSSGVCSDHAGDPCAGGAECVNVCNEGAGSCLVPNGAACDDGVFCNGADTCSAGECVHAGDPCSGGPQCANVCNEGAGNCLAPDGATCDDGAFCNGADHCASGTCATHAGDPCSSGPPCAAACNEGAHNCFDPTTVVCASDGNVCTDDHCNGAGGCAHSFNTAPCDDQLACTTNDACAQGVCAGTSVVCPTPDECHQQSSCDPATGLCPDVPKPEGTACAADKVQCTEDSCQAGVCQHLPLDSRCVSAQCVLAHCTPDDPGADPNGCTSMPVAEDQPCTDDGFTCSDDVCRQGRCEHVPVDSRCVPPGECTSAVCIPAGGAPDAAGCAPGVPRTAGQECAEDGDPCTTDVCTVASCAHAKIPNAVTCAPVEGAFRRALSLAGVARGLAADIAGLVTPQAALVGGPVNELPPRLEQIVAEIEATARILAGKSAAASGPVLLLGGQIPETPAQERGRLAGIQLRRTPLEITRLLKLLRRSRTTIDGETRRNLLQRGHVLLRGTRRLRVELQRIRRVGQSFIK